MYRIRVRLATTEGDGEWVMVATKAVCVLIHYQLHTANDIPGIAAKQWAERPLKITL